MPTIKLLASGQKITGGWVLRSVHTWLTALNTNKYAQINATTVTNNSICHMWENPLVTGSNRDLNHNTD